MSEGTLKPEKDFSKEVDKQLPEAEKLAQVLAWCCRIFHVCVLTTLLDRSSGCH